MKDKSKNKNTLPENFNIKDMEKNTLRLSLVIVLISVYCLFYVPAGSETWYVVIIVLALNAVLIAWVLARIILRKKAEKKNSDTDN